MINRFDPFSSLAKATHLKAVLIAAVLTASMLPSMSAAQTSVAGRLASEALAEQPPAARNTADPAAIDTQSLPWLELIFRGGWLMVPIALMSIIVVAIGVERAIALRRSHLLPWELVTRFQQMAERKSLDARVADELCEQSPSALARVVQSMLRKVGRAPSELEHSVSEACQREADRLYTNVRTLNLATSVAPLLGLLGTVLGMIQAFFATANLPLGSNKGQALAEGIYVALVTTFAGLSVAIPAAVLAHLFESRILRLLREIEQIALSMIPQTEPGDHQVRVDSPHFPARDISNTATQRLPKSKAS